MDKTYNIRDIVDFQIKSAYNYVTASYMELIINRFTEFNMKNFKGSKKAKGFNMIELTIVTAMTAILGAVAATEVTGNAEDARLVMLEALSDTLSTASQMNQNDMNDDNESGVFVTVCGDIAQLVQGGTLPELYAFTADNGAVTLPTAGTGPCTISTTTQPIQHAEFIGFGINNPDV
jgi:type II secretory pathway pseudopilin PulG